MTSPHRPQFDAANRLRDISRLLGQSMFADRSYLRRDLHIARARIDRRQDAEPILAQLLESATRSADLADMRRRSAPHLSYPPELPVSARKDEIADTIRKHQVVILCGATGSGKTTQLPKICLELGRGIHAMIGHTQPRRIAARAVALRIAHELNTTVGQGVGFKVRFADHVSDQSLIKLMTDGILLAEIQSDRMLWKYDTIILDEAHERSLNIDFLIGYLKRLLPRRPDLKLIITSATIAPERFSEHFDNAPIINVQGRTYPVEILYQPPDTDDPDQADLAQEQGILRAIDQLWKNGSGDTLIFLAGEREIRNTTESLSKHHPKGVDILPLFSRLSTEEQMRVFAPHNRPRLILATNIAETSLTVPGIRYVIDAGQARISRYGGRGTVQRLPIEPISRSSADQRTGRCGRTSPGVCVRLYSQEDFEQRPHFTDPEIRRTNLASVILQMKSLRLGGIEEFPYLDPPDYRQIRDGYMTLHELGAIDEQNELTDLGRMLAHLPTDPHLGRMILAARDFNCLNEILIIASALSLQDPRERPMDQQAAADAAHAEFRDPTSDFLSLLKLWLFFMESQKHLSENKLRKLCRDHFLSFTRLREWHDVHSQLKEMVGVAGWRPNHEPATYETIHRAILTGLISNIGLRGDDFEYQGIRGKSFFIFPGSTQFSRKPEWIIAAEIVETSRMYARTIAPVQPEWIEHAAAHMVRRDYDHPAWDRQSGLVMAWEKVTLHGLTLIAKRAVDYGSIDPRTSRELFIDGALVRQEFDCDAPFFRNNARLRVEVETLEAKQRRRDLLIDARTLFAFYDAKIPADAVSAPHFTRWRHQAERADRHILFMCQQDLLVKPAAHITPDLFPTTLGDAQLPLEYCFEVGHPADGVTLRVPITLLHQIEDRRLAWLVPGLLQDKLVELIRTLPKELRTGLVPHAPAAAAALAQMPFAQGDLLVSLAHVLGKQLGRKIDPAHFKPDQLDPYLRMNLCVVDSTGKTLAAGRDLKTLQQQLHIQARHSIEQTRGPWHRDRLTAWDFPDLPDHVQVTTGQMTVKSYPAILDKTLTVSLRLLESPLAAESETRAGIRRLAILSLADALSWQFKILTNIDQLIPLYKPLGTKELLRDTFNLALTDRLLFAAPAPIRTKSEFAVRLEQAWNNLRPTAEQLAKYAHETLSNRNDIATRLSPAFPPLLHAAINDMRQQLAALVTPDFLTVTPWEWLPHLPRFLAGIRIRLQRLTNAGLIKDANNAALFAPLWQTYQARTKAAQSAALPDPALLQFRYLLEELRISLFAQELKTSRPISVARLQKTYGAA